jgi:branched-chain amino acid aminotransferase
MNPYVWWINGEMVSSEDAMLPVADHGLTVGDGCFETTAIVRGAAFAMTRHLSRLRHSLSGLLIDLATTDTELRAATDAVVAANPGAGIIRITVTAGTGPLGSGRGEGSPTVVVAAGPNRGWGNQARVITVSWPRNERGALAGIKSTSYAENVIALARAKAAGASEAIFPNTLGNLCEGTGTNIFVEHEGRLVTPPLTSGCLAGVTRGLVVETSEVDEIDLPIEVLSTTTEAFLTSSTRDVMPIDRIDDRVLKPGPLTAAASAAFAALAASTLDP